MGRRIHGRKDRSRVKREIDTLQTWQIAKTVKMFQSLERQMRSAVESSKPSEKTKKNIWTSKRNISEIQETIENLQKYTDRNG